MLPALFKEYSDILEDWIDEVERERKTLETTRSPVRFQHAFINLLARLAYFDALHAETTDLTWDIEKKITKYTSQRAGLTPLGKPDKEGSLIKQRRAVSKKKSKKEKPSVKPDQSVTELRAWELFNLVVQELESTPEKYSQLGKTYLMEVLATWSACIDTINRTLDRSPPPEPAEIHPLIRELIQTITVWEKVKVKQALENPRLGTAFYNAVHRIASGQDNLKLLNNQKIPLASSRPWEDQEVVLRREEVKNEQRTINERLKDYGKQASAAPRVLKILDQMNPEFPVFLPRLAELTEMDKEETEKVLKFVLQMSPNIGRYDAMSQVLVFNKPSDVEKLIDDLLKQYETSLGEKK